MEVEQMLMLFKTVFTSYGFPGLNVRIPNKTYSNCNLDKDYGSMYGKLKKTFTYMLGNLDMNF